MDIPPTHMQLPMNVHMNKYGVSPQRVTATKGKQVKTEQKKEFNYDQLVPGMCVELSRTNYEHLVTEIVVL